MNGGGAAEGNASPNGGEVQEFDAGAGAAAAEPTMVARPFAPAAEAEGTPVSDDTALHESALEDGEAVEHEPELSPEPELTEEHVPPFLPFEDEAKPRRRFPFFGRRRDGAEPVAPAVAEAPKPRGRLMRVLPIVLLVIGALLIAEAVVTVVWKEPISTLLTLEGQSKLGSDLKRLEQQAAAENARNHAQMVRYQERAAAKLNRTAKPGDPIGRLVIPRTGLNMVVVQSTAEDSLKKGPAHYTETPLPGAKGTWTTGIAGHRTTYEAPFRHNDDLKPGDKIYFTLPYGRFTYSVTKTRIVDASYTQAFVPQGRNMIVLTACHPLYSAAQRILVYGKLVKSEPAGKGT